MAEKEFSEESIWFVILVVIGIALALIMIYFFASERAGQAGSLTNAIFKFLLCDIMYLFFGPSCATFGV